MTSTHNSNTLLEVSGAVSDIENVFHVHMFEYKRPESNATFYAPDVDPSIDLAVPVLQIKGLNNYESFHPNSIFKKIKSNNGVHQNAGSGLNGLYIGNDFRNAYAPGVSLNGNGQYVGLLQFDGYNPADIKEYEQLANLPQVLLENIYIGGFNGKVQTQSGQSEVTLDIDMAVAMAPGLTKVVVFEADEPQYFDVILDSMAAHSEIKQFSTSWALSPDNPDPTADGYFERMAAQGQSFFCASGDRDAYSNSSITMNGQKLTSTPEFPESDTNITDVGGTELSMNSNGATWSSDVVWNTDFDQSNNLYWGSSGGFSANNAIPSWQKSVSTTNNNRSTQWRNIPDVALTADSVFIVMIVMPDTNYYISSGTSCAAPLWAGFTALVNQQAVAGGKSTVGFLNPAIYSIGTGARYASDFHDVTTGNNEWPGSPTRYTAVSGYDLTTGWGTPNGQNLIDDLTGSLPGQITNGTASPTSGTITTNFSFSAIYQSPTGQAPDSINVVIDNKSYKMTAQGSAWINGVTFNYSYPAFFTTGRHNYYFTGSIAGSVSIKYPLNDSLQFNIGAVTPGVVQQVSPLNKSVGIIQPVELKWLNFQGATSYDLQLSTDSTFLSIIKDTIGVADTVFTVGGLNNLTIYYWRINAANTAGTSAWSQVWSFKTLGDPTIANLIYPANNSVNIPVAVKFLWNQSQDELMKVKLNGYTKNYNIITGAGSERKRIPANVSGYGFELLTDTTSTNYVVNDSIITDTTVQVTGLKNLTNYWWRVKAMNQAGWGAFTSWNRFTTIIDTPVVAVLLSPNNSSIIVDTATSILFTWKSALYASAYELQIATDNQFNSVLLDSAGIPDTMFTYHPKKLISTFYWEVRASNIAGPGPWSAVMNVSVIAGINNIKNGIPVVYNLYQNYPNPFNPSTMIIFTLPFNSKVKIEVYNILGERVRELVNEQKSAGYYEVNFNTTGLSSGVYLYMIEAKSLDGKSEYVNTKKMMLLK